MSRSTLTDDSHLPPHPAERGMQSALVGIGVNFILAGVKATAGIVGNSYALVADAVESASDVLTSLAVYFGLKVAAKPADENHPQGHGKAEPLAAMVVAVALFGAAILIAMQSIKEILTPHSIPAPWTLLVLVLVIFAKELLFRWVLKVGSEMQSTAVQGDAWHHRSDAITSAAAFVGISIALVGGKGWEAADDWAALLASMFIGFNACGILQKAIYELTDGHPDTELEAQIRKIALAIPDVVNLHKCFIRKMGFDYYVEIDVRVDRNMPVFRAHDVAHQVQDAVRAEIADKRFARVMVHIEPTLPPAEGE